MPSSGNAFRTHLMLNVFEQCIVCVCIRFGFVSSCRCIHTSIKNSLSSCSSGEIAQIISLRTLIRVDRNVSKCAYMLLECLHYLLSPTRTNHINSDPHQGFNTVYRNACICEQRCIVHEVSQSAGMGPT